MLTTKVALGEMTLLHGLDNDSVQMQNNIVNSINWWSQPAERANYAQTYGESQAEVVDSMMEFLEGYLQDLRELQRRLLIFRAGFGQLSPSVASDVEGVLKHGKEA